MVERDGVGIPLEHRCLGCRSRGHLAAQPGSAPVLPSSVPSLPAVQREQDPKYYIQTILGSGDARWLERSVCSNAAMVQLLFLLWTCCSCPGLVQLHPWEQTFQRLYGL